jgi:arylsulfatase
MSLKRKSALLALACSCALLPSSLLAQPAPPAPVLRTVPAKGSPNVVVILLDDVGFGATSAFGGPIPTPVLESLAKQGLRYNRFHTTSICSPTRASLLTGRNPHAVGMGAVMNSADDRPGYDGFQTKDAVGMAELLRRAGYNTAAFGKWHQTPDFETSPNGPFDRWPTGQGFEHFYGFIGGETDQFEPTLYDGTSLVRLPNKPGYHLSEDLADKAAAWLKQQHAIEPDRPAFLYFAPGAAHAPLQAPRAWIDRFKGKFDQGWDALQAETVARQRKQGTIPPGTRAAQRPEGIPAWSSLTPEQRRNSARLMEVYAGYLAHCDAQVGKLIDALKAGGEFDNTLLIYVVGDNGSSGEGGLYGSLNYVGGYQFMPETDVVRTAQYDRMGGPGTNTHFPAGFAWALDAPFPWMKSVASHLGGTRNGMVITWPKAIGAMAGGLRSQFGHVNDIMPTVLEATGLAAPPTVDGIAQKPLDGTSLLYTFADPKAPERHHTQYFEVFGNRAIYSDGWMASTYHGRKPWNVAQPSTIKFEDDRWELYDLRTDFAQAKDLAASQPAKLAELRALFDSEAKRNNVLPLKNIVIGTGLPSLGRGRTSATFYEGAAAIPASALPSTVARSWKVEAQIETGAESKGVIAALGGGAAGWSIFLKPDGTPAATYRLFNIQTLEFSGAKPLAPGAHKLKLAFAYDGGGFGKGGSLSLAVDGETVGQGHLQASPVAGFTLDDPFSVGVDTGSQVGPYPQEQMLGYAFRGGRIGSVTVSNGQ